MEKSGHVFKCLKVNKYTKKHRNGKNGEYSDFQEVFFVNPNRFEILNSVFLTFSYILGSTIQT